MISSEKYFRPSIGNITLAAYGFIDVESQNKPIFILPRCIIIEVIITGPLITADGVAIPDPGDHSVILGIAGDNDKFLASDSTWFGKNPIAAWFGLAEAGLGGVLGTGVVLENYTLREEAVIVGTFNKGTSGANGGGPLMVVLRYLAL